MDQVLDGELRTWLGYLEKKKETVAARCSAEPALESPEFSLQAVAYASGRHRRACVLEEPCPEACRVATQPSRKP